MEDAQTRFLKTHMAHQRPLFGYLLAAVRDPVDAEDLLQAVTLVLWKKFADYRPEVPYLAWAMGIARREVAAFFRSRGRTERLLSLEILDQVAAELHEEHSSAESRALHGCVDKLAEPHRELLQMRYRDGQPLAEVARRLGQTLAAVNMKIVRIRRALLECTKRAAEAEA